MIKPKSISKEYTLVWSQDPALQLPLDEKAADEALRIARQTNKWDALIKPGELPTLFQVEPMKGTTYSWLTSEQKRRNFAGIQLYELALALVLVRVDNFGDFRIEHTTNRDGLRVVSPESLDELYKVHRELIEELGGIVMLHAVEGISPLA